MAQTFLLLFYSFFQKRCIIAINLYSLKPLLICAPSVSCVPADPVFPARSLPARSTRTSLPSAACMHVGAKMEWLVQWTTRDAGSRVSHCTETQLKESSRAHQDCMVSHRLVRVQQCTKAMSVHDEERTLYHQTWTYSNAVAIACRVIGYTMFCAKKQTLPVMQSSD